MSCGGAEQREGNGRDRHYVLPWASPPGKSSPSRFLFLTLNFSRKNHNRNSKTNFLCTFDRCCAILLFLVLSPSPPHLKAKRVPLNSGIFLSFGRLNAPAGREVEIVLLDLLAADHARILRHFLPSSELAGDVRNVVLRVALHKIAGSIEKK